MKNSVYPTLLNKRARIFANLNRVELVVMALVYVTLSQFRVSGLIILGINLILLMLIKFISAKTKKGFFTNLNSGMSFNWRLGEFNEK